MRVESAFIAPNAATDWVETAASAPPESTRSASPYWMVRKAMPRACPAEAQAELVAKFVPCSPNLIEICPLIALGIIFGMKCGEARRGPRSSTITWWASMAMMPPMPVPMMQPKRSRSTDSMSI